MNNNHLLKRFSFTFWASNLREKTPDVFLPSDPPMCLTLLTAFISSRDNLANWNRQSFTCICLSKREKHTWLERKGIIYYTNPNHQNNNNDVLHSYLEHWNMVRLLFGRAGWHVYSLKQQAPAKTVPMNHINAKTHANTGKHLQHSMGREKLKIKNKRKKDIEECNGDWKLSERHIIDQRDFC